MGMTSSVKYLTLRTIHALLTKVIEGAVELKIERPLPRAVSIPTGSSIERIDVRIML